MHYTYQQTYPFFYKLISDIKLKVNRRIEFGNSKDSELAFLFDLLTRINNLERALLKQPTISNVNFEQSINDLIIKDREIDSVTIHVHLKGINSTKRGFINFYLKK